jgi:hypothetical protein
MAADLDQILTGVTARRAEDGEKNLVEHDFRKQVREEISQILNNLEHGSRWIYGTKENQPKNSRMGQITRGGLGIGFK